jgi:hypothetical protein
MHHIIIIIIIIIIMHIYTSLPLWSAFLEVISHIDALQSFSLIAVTENDDDNDTFASCCNTWNHFIE